MPDTLKITPTDALRCQVDRRTRKDDLEATRDERVCDMIEQGTEDQMAIDNIMRGLDDAKGGRISINSILDIGKQN